MQQQLLYRCLFRTRARFVVVITLVGLAIGTTSYLCCNWSIIFLTELL